MDKNIYGVVNNRGEHIDFSRSLKATKRMATIEGYTKVSVRHQDHYYVSIVAEKVDGKWKDNPQGYLCNDAYRKLG